MNVHRTKRTSVNTSMTADALFIVYHYDAVGAVNRVGGTGRQALCVFALAAYDRHAYYGMRIDGCNAYACFFWVVGALSMDGAGDLANPAAGAFFRDDDQTLSHIKPLRKSIKLKIPSC